MDLNDGGAAGADGNGSGQGGVASAADLLGGSAAAAAGAGAGGGAGDGGAGTDGGDKATPTEQWLAQFAADPIGDKPSMRDWVKATGAADVGALAQIARDNQAALRESGRVKVPGEGASEAEVAAFRKAIGVPDDAAGYKAPELLGEDGKPLELDQDTLAAATASALKHGLPAAAFSAFLQDQAEREALLAATRQQEIQAEADAVVRAWGDKAAENTAAVQRGLTALGFTTQEALAIRAAIGPKSALEKFAKLGAGISEDAMVRGEGEVQRFGMTGEQAQARLDQRMADADWAGKAVVPGSAENAEYERLNAAIGAAANRKQRASA